MSRSIYKRPRTSHSNINLIISNTITENLHSTSIQGLPNELLFAIFLYLPSEQTLLTIPLVCQQWSDLHNDPCLYRHLKFRGGAPDTSVAVTLIKMAPRLKSLKLASRTDTNEILRYVAICNPSLETLKLRSCRGTRSRYSVSSICMRSIMEYCSKLRRLSMRNTLCNSRKVYSEIGDRLPLLTAIDFGFSNSCSKVELINNADKFHKLFDLRIFENVYDDVVTRFCEKHSSSLTTVKLNIVECSDASLIALATCQQLRTLYLEDAEPVTDMGIMQISKLPNLEKLHISAAEEVTSPCWVSFFQTPNMKRIKYLSLDVCQNVNDDVAISLAQNLSVLQMLKLLDCNVLVDIRHMLPQHCHYVLLSQLAV